MNPEHVEIVRQGAEATNAWRCDHASERFDLSGVNFTGADLRRVDLEKADLAGTAFIGANLTEAFLRTADLSEADLPGANLSGADLPGVNLSGANLSGANLSGANLSGANLSGANLSWAYLIFTVFLNTHLERSQFEDAIFSNTILGDCDLSAALGLETVQHYNPSTIGLDTIVRSGDNIPEAFLRGAGVPDSIITYVRSLVAEPIQFYTCFISYSSTDQVVRRPPLRRPTS